MSQDNTSQETVIDEGNMSETDAEALGRLFLSDDDEAEETAKSEPVDEDVEDEQDDAQPDEDNAESEEDEDGELQASDEDEYEPIEDLSAKVRLPDGTETTLQELHNGNLRQADYTRKRQEDAEAARQLSEKTAQTAELEATLMQEREQMATVLKAFMPVAPPTEMMQTDPIGYMQAKEQFEQAQNAVQGALSGNQAAFQKQQEENQKLTDEFVAKEREAMLSVMPELRDPARYTEFSTMISGTLVNEYGFTEQELNQLNDHRMVQVVADAAEYRKLKKATPKTKKKLAGKPPVMTGRKRKSGNATAYEAAEKRIAKAQRSGDTSSVSDLLGQLLTS